MDLFIASHRMKNTDSKCTVENKTPNSIGSLKHGVRAIMVRAHRILSVPSPKMNKPKV